MFKKLNITCKQAVAICDKSQYKEATRNKSNDDKKKQISLCMTPSEKEFLKKEIEKRYVKE